ncbi:C40 family peptidase [Muriicola sp.]|uniref:C40 family peptidase n=1 Tax=Muriicola sp. TaxID=2020856 RepID=UPI003C74810B
MTNKILMAALCFSILSCGVVKKKTSYGSQRKITVEAEDNSTPEGEEADEKEQLSGEIAEELTILEKSEDIIDTALSFSGVRYKYGGTSRKGMDCSGLLYVSFLEHDIYLPRVSFYMANEGKRIDLTEVTKGDLLFFTTSKRRKRINHVGLVVDIEGEDIKFIHATASRGVIVSSLKEGYWNYAFVKATRVL